MISRKLNRENEVEFNSGGALAIVRFVSDDRREINLELRNGMYSGATSQEQLDLSVGDVVTVQENTINRVPSELWVERSWVGVVKIKAGNVDVVDGGGHWKLVPSNQVVEYAVGNTVEVTDSAGVQRVLHPDSIKLVEFGEVTEDLIKEFKPSPPDQPESFEDFGGLLDVVERARELVETPLLQHDRLAKINARPVKGVLFTGPPGAGKTMLARIIAVQSGAEFLEISGPQFISKWVGQSEAILRMIFEYAGTRERCIIFFDEIDSVAGKRNEESHESSRRVVAQLLTLMDGFTPQQNVIVIAATNRPQDIDRALLRPGRFDWEIEFPYPARADRLAILERSQRRHQVRGDLPHELVASKTEGWTGAELTAIWTEAALLAVKDDRDAIAIEDFLGGFQRVGLQHAAQSNERKIGDNR
jgi:transitional endoplasmic reticulum ATPase